MAAQSEFGTQCINSAIGSSPKPQLLLSLVDRECENCAFHYLHQELNISCWKILSDTCSLLFLIVMRHLCEKCAGLTFDDEAVARLKTLSAQNENWSERLRWSYASPAALKISADGDRTWKGCHLCALILRSLKSSHAVGTLQEDQDLPEGQIFLEVTPGPERVQLSAIIGTGESYRLGLPLHLSFEEDDGARGQEISPSADSDEVISLINQWSTDCVKDHEDCKADNLLKSWLPDRVIDVGPPDGSQRPFLALTRGKAGKYATLTHRWTPTDMGPTTKENLKARCDYLNMDEISPTFRDAIILCRRLNIRYLWIDAICIIQDSTEDWVHESNNMMLIYELGWLNISVAVSETDPGIFHKRKLRISKRCRLPASMSSLGGLLLEDSNDENAFDSSIYIHLASEDLGKSVHEGFLAQRGWVFQERILSPRTLYFSRDEIYWECNNMATSETVPWGWKNDENWPLVKFHSRKRFRDTQQVEVSADSEAIPTLSNDFTEREVYDFWYKLVEQYSKCDLTYKFDRLPAVKGLAQAIHKFAMPFAPAFVDEYGKGTWIRDMARGLLWKSESQKLIVSMREIEDELEVQDSFSWSSAKGAVSFPREIQGTPTRRIPMSSLTGSLLEDSSNFAIVREAQVTVLSTSSSELRIYSGLPGGTTEFMGKAYLDYEIYREATRIVDRLPVLCVHVVDASGFVWDHGIVVLAANSSTKDGFGQIVLGLKDKEQRPVRSMFKGSQAKRIGIYRNDSIRTQSRNKLYAYDSWSKWKRVPVYL